LLHRHHHGAFKRRLSLDFFGVFVLGILGLTGEAWMPPIPRAGVLHALFGVLLWVCVVLRFFRALYLADRPWLSVDIRAFARELSRKVYAVLYGEMLFDIALGALRPGVGLQHHLEAYQSYLAYGCAALATLWILRGAVEVRLLSIQRNGRLT
jgi:hypothetical protein